MFLDLSNISVKYFDITIYGKLYGCCQIRIASELLAMEKVYLSKENKIPSNAWNDIYRLLEENNTYKVLYINKFPND